MGFVVRYFSLCAVFVFANICFEQAEGTESLALTKIAFGSCLKQDQAQPIWKGILSVEPELWIWLGDNIYGDTADAAVLSIKYAELKANPDYEELRKKARVVGTWDDHDYGKNNAGKEFEGKASSQKALLDFLDTPLESLVRERWPRGEDYSSRLPIPSR